MDRREFGQLLTSLGVCRTVSGIPGELFTIKAARWYSDLNCWRWPADLGKPPGWIQEALSKDGRERYEIHKVKYKALMDALELMAGGRKECLRYWNVTKRSAMTNAQFERWHKSAALRSIWKHSTQ